MLEHARTIYLYMCHVCGVYSHDIPMNLHIYSHSILIHTQIPWLLGKHVIIYPMDSYDTVDGRNPASPWMVETLQIMG